VDFFSSVCLVVAQVHVFLDGAASAMATVSMIGTLFTQYNGL